MRILITAGPTRESIDSVRFISNASSGRMGYAVAEAAVAAGHKVTLLSGPVALTPPAGVTVFPFVSVEQLQQGLEEQFFACDALVMSAAVGDFTVVNRSATKLSRKAGATTLQLVPTPDLLAGVSKSRRADQVIVAFAVEDGTPEACEAKAREELAAKGADCTVLNTPAAMAAQTSRACVLTADSLLLPWAERSKVELAQEIVKLIETTAAAKRC